jgi:diguanylate cyclase (GGDEF)-like protein
MADPFLLDIFSLCSPDEYKSMEGCFDRRFIEAGQAILDSGTTGDELYIVLSGCVVSKLKLPGAIERKHGELREGDLFGESSVFGKKPQFATYSAAEKTELLVMKEGSILDLINRDPSCGMKLVSGLLGRTVRQFRSTSSFLSDVVQWGENASRRVITDDMTGLYNRAFLEDALDNFFNISKSNNKPLSLLMLDLDNCRKINELLDLETGNRIICECAAIINRVVKKHGIAARYGGDEFSILLPETDLEKAAIIAEQIRHDVESFDFSKYLRGHAIPVTTSIGISSFPETSVEFAEFKTGADAALYRAKQEGRNRVCFSG